MANSQQLAFAIRAVNEAQTALRQARDDVKGLVDQAERGGGSSGGLLWALGDALARVASIAGGFIVGQGLMRLPRLLTSAAQAAAEDAAEQLRLENALRNLGGAYEENLRKVNERIVAGQRLAFSDTQVRDSLQILTAATGDVDEALRRQALAMDFSRGANIPLEQASRLLGKVTAENVEVFKRLGITIGEGATEADAFAVIQARFGGQSETFANSTAGHFERVKIEMAELKERLGAQLLPVMTSLGDFLVTTAIPALNDFATTWETKLKPQIDAFVESRVLPEIEAALAQLKQTWEGLKPILEENPELIAAIGVALAALLVALMPIPAAIAAIIVAGTLVLAHWDDIRARVQVLVEDFKTKFPEAWLAVETVFNLIKNHIETVMNTIINIAQLFIAVFKGDWDRAWSEVKQIATGLWDGMVTHYRLIIEAIVGVTAGLGGRLLAAVSAGWNQEVEPFLSSLPGRAREGLADLGNQMWQAGMDAMQKLAGGIRRGVISFVGDAISGVIRQLNPRNWDIPGLSPWQEAWVNAGTQAMDLMAQGVTIRSRVVLDAVRGVSMGMAAAIQGGLAAIPAVGPGAGQWPAGVDVQHPGGFPSLPGSAPFVPSGAGKIGPFDVHELSAMAWAIFADPLQNQGFRSFSDFRRWLDSQGLGPGNWVAKLSLAQVHGVDVLKVWRDHVAARPGLEKQLSIEALLADLLPYGFKIAHTGWSGILARDTLFAARGGEHVAVRPSGRGAAEVHVHLHGLSLYDPADREKIGRQMRDLLYGVA